MNILEKHNLVKKLVSAAAMSFALLGGTYLVNNQTAQTVQAARRVVHVNTVSGYNHYHKLANRKRRVVHVNTVSGYNHYHKLANRKQRVVHVNTVSGYNHYRKLANRKGTHYFGYTVQMSDWAMGTGIYSMSGKLEDNDWISDTVILGTKTINGKHFFIATDYPGKFLVLANDYYAPTSYQVNNGQTVQVWGQEETTNDNGDIIYHNNAIPYLKFHGGKYFMVLDERGSRNTFTDANGVVYRAVVESDGTSNYIKQSDLAKMHKAAHTYRINGATFDKNGRLIGGID